MKTQFIVTENEIFNLVFQSEQIVPCPLALCHLSSHLFCTPSSQEPHPHLKYIKNLGYNQHFFDYWLIFDLYSECPWARLQAVMTKFTGGAGYGEGFFLKALYCEEAL